MLIELLIGEPPNRWHPVAWLASLLAALKRRAQQTTTRDHSKTDSPNAGWPMSAMAGALGVSLEKIEQYRLGDGPPPCPTDISRSLRVAGAAAALFSGSALLIQHLAKARSTK